MTQNNVAVLGVLHSFHNVVSTYSLNHLRAALEKLKPDVICVELMQSELESDKEQKFKIEYQVILPFSRDNSIPVLGMDPEEPAFSKMVDPYIANQRRFDSTEPSKAKLQGIYQNQLFDYLINEQWSSLANTQSEITHVLFDLKHRFQNELMGEAEREGWNKFNEYYLNKIEEVAAKYSGKTVLVTIGIEHVYWLLDRLRQNKDILVLDLESLLK